MRKVYSFTEALQHAILSGLDLLPIAFLVLDENGKTLVANRAARRIVPNPQARNLHRVLRELVASSGKAGKRSTVTRIVERDSGKPLSILAVPVSIPEPVFAGDPVSVVFVGDPDFDSSPDPALLSKLFGFTPAEANVAALMMLGNTVEEIAEKLRISPHTARNHLKRLFSKTSTKRQSELVHMLMSSPACPRGSRVRAASR